MDRRSFVTSALALGGAAIASHGVNAEAADAQASPTREFYQLRRYTLRNGPQTALIQNYFQHALIPALNRMGFPQTGAFQLDVGPDTPTFYMLIPSTSAEKLLTLDLDLPHDTEFAKAAADFWAAPATATAFERVDVTMMSAFTGFPKPAKRIFQLRIYESPSHAAHMKKVAMFNEGEIAIFQKTGLTPVFFAHNLSGTKLPSLTYMLTFADIAELTAHWATFANSPEWKELSGRPGLSNAEIVNNITNLYLSPLPSSQI